METKLVFSLGKVTLLIGGVLFVFSYDT
jgi:hypothetical protein